MVSVPDQRAGRDRARANDPPGTNVWSESLNEVQGRLVSPPAVLSLGVVEQLVCGRFVEECAPVREVLDVIELILTGSVKALHLTIPDGIWMAGQTAPQTPTTATQAAVGDPTVIDLSIGGAGGRDKAHVAVQLSVRPKPADLGHVIGNQHREEPADARDGHQPVQPLVAPREIVDQVVARTDTLLQELKKRRVLIQKLAVPPRRLHFGQGSPPQGNERAMLLYYLLSPRHSGCPQMVFIQHLG